MNQSLDPHVVVTSVAFVSIFLILAILVILARSKTVEMKLILIGVFMAIASGMIGSIAGLNLMAGPGGVSIGVGSGAMSKVATILILSGVALAALNRPGPVAIPTNIREA